MKTQKYVVKLETEDRVELEKFSKSKSKKATPKCKNRAKVILCLDENGKKPLNVDETAKKCNLHPESVYTIRKDFIVFGMERITQRKKRGTPPVEPKVTGDIEAHIIATACSQPPEGRAKWTLQLLADRIVLDGAVESIGRETVRRTLKKRNISLI